MGIFTEDIISYKLASYVPIKTPVRKLLGVPESASYVLIRPPTRKLFGTPLYAILEENRGQQFDEIVVHVGNRTPLRTVVFRQFTDKFANKARKLGIGLLFNKLMPLLIQPTLEDEERHRVMKVIDRVLHKLDEQPSIDEDYYARVEGGEIILN